MSRASESPLAVVVAACVISACSGAPVEEPAPDGPVVERTTVDGVTTVRNVSGSEWPGGVARLEEIVTIGGEESEEYMFQMPFQFWATDDLVLVADVRANSVRGSTARAGSCVATADQVRGPGEYEQLFGVGLLADGRVMVQAFPESVIYELDGAFAEEWRVPPSQDGLSVSFNPMVGVDGRPYRMPTSPATRSGRSPTTREVTP